MTRSARDTLTAREKETIRRAHAELPRERSGKKIKYGRLAEFLRHWNLSGSTLDKILAEKGEK